MLTEDWHKLTPDEKLETRFSSWISAENKQFSTSEAAQAYGRRIKRYYEIVKLQQPDRVPRMLSVGNFVAQYAGATYSDFFYDYDKSIKAMIKFHRDFDLDYAVTGNFLPGKTFDLLDYKLYSWPGGKFSKDRPFQCLEKEYMMADEYESFIAGPEAFLSRIFMPRALGALEGFQMLPSALGATELPFLPFMLAALGMPPVHDAIKTLMEASQATLEWLDASTKISAKTQGEMGLPGIMGGASKAPFDFIGDTLRGTRGIMLDMYRQPEKVIEACERLIPLAVTMAVTAANLSGIPVVLMPLHKGADGFMSNADFERFYWPSLKATMLGMIDEGVVPCLFVEGAYNHRLDIIAESGLPTGKTIWYFDQTDMAAAKEKFGSWACIGGNVPASLFKAGTPQQMEDAVKRLIDTAGPGGGYFIAPGVVIDDAETANVHAYLKAAKEYGVY